MERRLPPESRRELYLLLRLLASRWGSLVLLGRASFRCGRSCCGWIAAQNSSRKCSRRGAARRVLADPSCLPHRTHAALPAPACAAAAPCSGSRWLPTAFPDLPLPEREAVLLGWSASPDPRMRKVRQLEAREVDATGWHRLLAAAPSLRLLQASSSRDACGTQAAQVPFCVVCLPCTRPPLLLPGLLLPCRPSRRSSL